MARKPRRGYFVKGHFVEEGSELDLELKRQQKHDRDNSKTDQKRHSEALQQLGKDLLGLRPRLMRTLDLPERLLEALAEAQRISDFEGRRRQMQYIGKLMRGLDEDTVASIQHALQEQKAGSAAETALLHQAEQWRDRLIDAARGDAALGEWLAQYGSSTDAQQLRSLVRQARKDAQAQAGTADAGQAPRHGKAYRSLFQLLRAVLVAAQTGQDAVRDGDDDVAPHTALQDPAGDGWPVDA